MTYILFQAVIISYYLAGIFFAFFAFFADCFDARGDQMSTVQATSIEQAKDLLKSGAFRKVELSFEIDSDEFFNFASEFCSEGAKITQKNSHFVVTLPKSILPSKSTN